MLPTVDTDLGPDPVGRAILCAMDDGNGKLHDVPMLAFESRCFIGHQEDKTFHNRHII